MSNDKPKRPNKFITFEVLTFELLQRVTDATELTTSQVVGSLLQAHVQELTEFCQWIEMLHDDVSDRDREMRKKAIHALKNYGTSDLITALKTIDREYAAPDQIKLFVGESALTSEEVAQVRKLLRDLSDTE